MDKSVDHPRTTTLFRARLNIVRQAMAVNSTGPAIAEHSRGGTASFFVSKQHGAMHRGRRTIYTEGK